MTVTHRFTYIKLRLRALTLSGTVHSGIYLIFRYHLLPRTPFKQNLLRKLHFYSHRYSQFILGRQPTRSTNELW
jgi:hypothetical protein